MAASGAPAARGGAERALDRVLRLARVRAASPRSRVRGTRRLRRRGRLGRPSRRRRRARRRCALGLDAERARQPAALGAGALELTRARALGVRWIREELAWSAIERSPGHYRWRRFDALMIAAARARLHVLPLLLGTPWWAGPGIASRCRTTRARSARSPRMRRRATARAGGSGVRIRGSTRGSRRSGSSCGTSRTTASSRPPASTRPATRRWCARRPIDGRAANRATRWLMAADLTYLDGSGRRHAVAAGAGGGRSGPDER